MTNNPFDEISKLSGTRFADSPLGQSTNDRMFDKPLSYYDKPLGAEAKAISFSGIRDSFAYSVWKDGINDRRELDSKVYLTYVDELCRDWGLSGVKSENIVSGTGDGTGMSFRRPFVKDTLFIEISQEWNDALKYGNESPMLSAGHETAHHAVNDFRARRNLSKLQEEMFADRFAVFSAALENVDLRDEIIALRSTGNNPDYPNRDMTVVNANQAYDLAEKYKGTEFTPSERCEMLKGMLIDFGSETKELTTDNYQNSKWFQSFESKDVENTKNLWQTVHSGTIPDIFSGFVHH